MNKPTKKREVAVRNVWETEKIILFDATPEASNHFREFGGMYRIVSGGDGYSLLVDARYDFDEVVRYIESYGSEKSELVLVVREEDET